ncbi:hypothetical protein CHS0354_023459 [Potamilus streckersoni]|uniref:Uncharacterized protein n=1 Tax=Potamilus streckersoni TaxID=2493646 RepID=A0AAE0S474_9BIVA|nr:hypothetical protein CHS0354_023459 [Potamilus streckersoni]
MDGIIRMGTGRKPKFEQEEETQVTARHCFERQINKVTRPIKWLFGKGVVSINVTRHVSGVTFRSRLTAKPLITSTGPGHKAANRLVPFPT